MVSHTYDSEADALYIELGSGKVVRTREAGDCTLVDLDEAGRAVGIEVLQPARAWPLEEIIEAYKIDSGTAAMLRAMYPSIGAGGARVSFEGPARDGSATDSTFYATV